MDREHYFVLFCIASNLFLSSNNHNLPYSVRLVSAITEVSKCLVSYHKSYTYIDFSPVPFSFYFIFSFR